MASLLLLLPTASPYPKLNHSPPLPARHFSSSFPVFSCSFPPSLPLQLVSSVGHLYPRSFLPGVCSRRGTLSFHGSRQSKVYSAAPLARNKFVTRSADNDSIESGATLSASVAQVSLWILTGVYVFWLFLLPYAPGDPVWAIKPATISMLIDLSHNFFYILPAANAVGIDLMKAPVIHPTTEALFNFIMGWTLMFAPLLFTDRRRDRYGGSLELLWAIQMFLTNTVLIPYMAIRLNTTSKDQPPSTSNTETVKLDFSGVASLMTSGARVLGAIGGAIGLVSLLWFFIGRVDEGFGDLSDRWTFFLEYLNVDRPGYAFIWDATLYSIFQPWLIGANLANVKKGRAESVVRVLRFVPYVGLVAYLWFLVPSEE